MSTNTSHKQTTIPFRISRMPLIQAFKWLKNASLLLKAQPWTLCVTTAWLFLTLIVLVQTPVIGGALAAVVFPALSFGMADVNQKIRLQHPVSPLDVFSGFHPTHRISMLAVGGFLAILLTFSFTLMQQFDLSPLAKFSEQLLNQNQAIDISEFRQQIEQLLQTPEFISALTIANLFSLGNLVILLGFTYAPLFVAWQKAQPVQAVGLSLRLIVRNILPLLLLVVIVFGIIIVVINLMGLLMMILPLFGAWLMLPVIFLLFAFIHALIFASYHNIITTSLAYSIQSVKQ